MQVAIAVGTLLLGGWVLGSPDQDQTSVIQKTQPVADINQLTEPETAAPAPSSGRTTRTRGERTARENRDTGGTNRGAQLSSQQQLSPDDIVAPTESAPDAESLANQPMQPTAAPESEFFPGMGMMGAARILVHLPGSVAAACNEEWRRGTLRRTTRSRIK